MNYTKYKNMVNEAMRTGAAIAPDGTQLIYHDGMFCTERYFAVYDVNGNCVDVAYSSIDLYYLFK